MNTTVKVALAQMDIVWEDREKSLQHLERLLSEVDLRSCDLVLLPEMFASGFSMHVERVATPRDGPVVSWMRRLAARHGVSVLGSHAEIGNGAAANTAVLVRPDGSVEGAYRKIHLFQDERDHYVAGNSLFLFSLCGAPATVFICYDLRFPELFRAASARGVQVFLIPANWPAARSEHWEILLRARAVENQAFVCACNRTGIDPNNSYSGGSCVIGPQGNMIARFDDAARAEVVEFDLADVRAFRSRFDVLADRRPQLYRDLGG